MGLKTLSLAGMMLAGILPTTQARALPVGPPHVEVTATPTADPFTYNIQAYAEDPDGVIRSLVICVAEGFDEVCTSSSTESERPRIAQARACVRGDWAETSRQKTFVSYGVFQVTATAVGGGCPVIGGDEEAVATTSVVISPPPEPIPCADAGTPTASAPGVSEDEIEIATTVNLSSPEGRSAIAGMYAAVDRVNGSGGVCGRMLSLTAVDDGGDAAMGLQMFRNLIADEQFALVVGPSGGSMRALIVSGDVGAAQIPVVGTLGQTDAEFSSPWVFPAAPSSTDFGRIAVRRAIEANAAHIALVYSSWDDSGIEARQGVLDALAQNPGMTLEFEVGIGPSGGVASEVAHYANACQNICDALIVAADPGSIVRWFTTSQSQGVPKIPSSIPPRAQLLQVVRNCGDACSEVTAWSGFTPPAIQSGSAVARYVEDLRAHDATVDPNDAFAEGAYAGIMVLARGIGMAGTDLTRAGLRTALETQSIDLGLTRDPLTWPANRNANPALRGMSMIYSGSSFVGWRFESDWLTP